MKIFPEVDIMKQVPEIKKMGYVKTMRDHDTGIGFTYESLLGIKENNLKNHDFTYGGEEVECKTRRRGTSANLTMFTKEPPIRDIKDVELMKKYGYTDQKGRLGLKPDCVYGQFNPQNLSLSTDEKNETISLIDSDGYKPWTWTCDDISKKMRNLLLVFADSKKENGSEYFFYDEAYYLKDFDRSKFLGLIKNKKIVVNLRMHQKDNGTSRNHGTAFRISSMDELMDCYGAKIQIV